MLNNTYVINSSTVLTLRGGFNGFDDNYILPEPFDAAGLFNNPGLTGQMSDTDRFPTTAITGYKGSGWTSRQTNNFYQYGTNGSLSKLAGRHSYKFGGDYRLIGVKALNYGNSTGSYTFTGTYSGNAIADLLLGYPQSGNIPLNQQLDGFVRYSAGYAQDDWRVNDRLTLNYGVRLERETGLQEKDNQITVNFDQTVVNPLNNSANVIDPITGARRTIMGGLVFAGQNGAPTEQGNQPAIKAAPRVGAVYSLTEKTVLRGGWGLYYSPVGVPVGRHELVGPVRLFGDDRCSAVHRERPDRLDEQPVPERYREADRYLAWLPDRRRRHDPVRRSEQGRLENPAVVR